MKSTLGDIVKKLPDFEEMLAIAQEVRDLSLQKLLIENALKTKESDIYKEAMVNEKYFIGGKQPAISYIKSAYEHGGFSGELVQAREELAKVSAELDYKKQVMSVYKEMIGIFQTLSANERGVSL